jgi:hypothetical protein
MILPKIVTSNAPFLITPVMLYQVPTGTCLTCLGWAVKRRLLLRLHLFHRDMLRRCLPPCAEATNCTNSLSNQIPQRQQNQRRCV